MSTTLLREESVQYKSNQDDLYRMSINRYHEVVESGLFDEDDQIELLQGFLVNKMTINPAHRAATGKLFRKLLAVLPDDYFAESQAPITLSDSEPEPDIYVVRGEPDDFLKRHPFAPEIPLVIEVSYVSLSRDQGWKKEIYARAGIPVYWIVNLVDTQIEIYENAGTVDYLTKHTYLRGDELPITIDGEIVATLNVSDLLP